MYVLIIFQKISEKDSSWRGFEPNGGGRAYILSLPLLHHLAQKPASPSPSFISYLVSIFLHKKAKKMDQVNCAKLFLPVCFCICHHCVISFQKIYVLYGLEHHTEEINGDVTKWDNKLTREDRATQSMDTV